MFLFMFLCVVVFFSSAYEKPQKDVHMDSLVRKYHIFGLGDLVAWQIQQNFGQNSRFDEFQRNG